MASLAASWGYDGLEIACWGDHLDVERAASDPGYVQNLKAILERYGLVATAVSNHLAGQAICDDPIDQRHKGILPQRVWGDGIPEGVRERAAQEMILTGQAAKALGVTTVVGFSGSAIWKSIAGFPPPPAGMIARGYEDFARRFLPILDRFHGLGIRFALEVHPSEIAFDYWTAKETLSAINNHPAFGFNFDPSHFLWQQIDPSGFLLDFADHILHVHCKESTTNLNGRNATLGSLLPWGDGRRGWDFVSVGHGGVDWEVIFRALNQIRYNGPLSVEWEDAGMDRMQGAPEALEYIRRLDATSPPMASFDSAFAAD